MESISRQTSATDLAFMPLASSDPLPINPRHFIEERRRREAIAYFAGQHQQKRMTKAEWTFWQAVRNNQLGLPCRHQHPISSVGIADFCFPTLSLIIEIDGEYHQTPEQRAKDHKRTKALDRLGYDVLRFTNKQVFTDLDGCLTKVRRYIWVYQPADYRESIRRRKLVMSAPGYVDYLAIRGLDYYQIMPHTLKFPPVDIYPRAKANQ